MTEDDLEERIRLIVGRVIGAIPPQQVECLRYDVRRLVADVVEDCARVAEDRGSHQGAEIASDIRARGGQTGPEG